MYSLACEFQGAKVLAEGWFASSSARGLGGVGGRFRCGRGGPIVARARIERQDEAVQSSCFAAHLGAPRRARPRPPSGRPAGRRSGSRPALARLAHEDDALCRHRRTRARTRAHAPARPVPGPGQREGVSASAGRKSPASRVPRRPGRAVAPAQSRPPRPGTPRRTAGPGPDEVAIARPRQGTTSHGLEDAAMAA